MKSFTLNTVNPRVLKAEYAVRGAIVIKGMEYEEKLKKGEKLSFDSIVYCNIGNPQILKQKPITFLRQVLACVNYPELLNKDIFPQDVIERSKKYLDNIPGGVGAYSHSKGVPIVRNEVADYLLQRDGLRPDIDDIYLTDGASSGVKSILSMLISSKEDGIMVPIPQYPLYSATIDLYGGTQIPYYLTEEDCWGLRIEDLENSYNNSLIYGIKPRALVVINPGNPTGQCLSYNNIKDIILFCINKKILIMADEVYQDNIYNDNKTFISFRKVAIEMLNNKTIDINNNIELISYHSTSKGYFGECGRRGGYMELYNIDKDIKEQIYKIASISLCSNIEGQITTGIMINPPKINDISYNNYINEKNNILNSLKHRAIKLEKSFNKLKGINCQKVEGALYAFPSIILNDGIILAAKEKKLKPDVFYCFELLHNTGIVVVPGSGFGQKDGTYHFRITILPPEDQMDQVIERFTNFHNHFLDKYQNYKGKEKLE